MRLQENKKRKASKIDFSPLKSVSLKAFGGTDKWTLTSMKLFSPEPDGNVTLAIGVGEVAFIMLGQFFLFFLLFSLISLTLIWLQMVVCETLLKFSMFKASPTNRKSYLSVFIWFSLPQSIKK